MSAEVQTAIASLYEELKKLETKTLEIKRTINTLASISGLEQPFPNIEGATTIGSPNIRPDQFFGKALSTAVKEFLRSRGRAYTAQEIYDALTAGGFEFPDEWKEKFRLKNLSISLSKNRTDFVYLKSSKAYGLWEFYPDKKRERDKIAKPELAESVEGTSTSDDSK